MTEVNVVNITQRYTICEKIGGLHGLITFQLQNWIFIESNTKMELTNLISDWNKTFLFLLFFSSSTSSSVTSGLSSSSSSSLFPPFHFLCYWSFPLYQITERIRFRHENVTIFERLNGRIPEVKRSPQSDAKSNYNEYHSLMMYIQLL